MSVPEDEERLLPLVRRWPRASNFVLSGCAATVAELGTRTPTPGPLPPAAVAPPWKEGWQRGEGAGAVGPVGPAEGSVPGGVPPARLRPVRPPGVRQVWRGAGKASFVWRGDWGVTKVFAFQFRLPGRCAMVPKRVLLGASS